MEDSWKVAQELIEKEMTKDEIMNFMVSEVLETDADDYVIAKIRQVRDKINNPLSKMNPYQRHYHKSRVEMIKKVARGEIFLSEARQLNLMKAFPNVNWNFKSAECINPGCLGDKPQFRVEGFLKYKPEDFICEESKGFEFVYTWASPGGGQSNLKVFQDGKKVFHRHPATFKNAENIWKAFENKCLK